MGFAGFFVRLGTNALISGNRLRTWWCGLKPATREWTIAAAIGVILFVAGLVIHQHIAHRALADARADQELADTARFDRELKQAHADALAWRDKAAAEGQAIAKLEKEKNDAQVRAHAAAAADLLVRGPGAAASRCRSGDPASISAGAGRHDGDAPTRAAAGSEMPPGNWATVPWEWLVAVVQEHDDLRSEALSWRSDYGQQRDAWDRLRSAPTQEPAK